AGVVVSYAPQANAVSVAELTVGLMIALARRIPAADRDTRTGGWRRQRFTGVELMGKTLGVVGLGRIGTLTARRARALGMTIVAHAPCADPSGPAVRESDARLLSLEDVLAEADVVSCHLPLAAETAGLFNYERLCRMKRGALFINTSRGEVVD